METLVFRCPQTGNRLRTELTTDRATLRMIGAENIKVECRACGRPHIFKVRDAQRLNAA